MNKITIIEGRDLAMLCNLLSVPESERPRRLRVWQSPDGDAVKIKANSGMWTPPMGEKDEEAR